MRLPSQASLDVAQVKKKGLYEFVKRAWSQIEPSTFVSNWHLEEKCKLLEAVHLGECTRFSINEPPGCSKSLIASVMFPVWSWVQDPTSKWFYGSFDATLASRDARKSINLIQSEWFQERWSHVTLVQGAGEKTAAGRVAVNAFFNSEGGLRFSSSCPWGKATGWHFNYQMVDDPTKPMAANGPSQVISINALETVAAWYNGTMPSRMTNQKTGRRGLIMQRIHEQDLTGVVLAQGGYTELRFPMRYEVDNPCVTPWASDRRTEEGELLWPERFPAEVCDKLEKEYDDPANVAAQFQQRPGSKSGDIFKRETFKPYDVLPKGFGQYVQSWDLTFKEGGTSRVCGDLWYGVGSNYYLVDWICRSMGFPETLEVMRRLNGLEPNPEWTKDLELDNHDVLLWARAGAKLVENKANGPAIMSSLEGQVPGIVSIDPKGTKIERAVACNIYYKAGNVWHPSMARDKRIKAREDILVGFPRARFNDEVDTTSQVLMWFAENKSTLGAAMSRMSG